MNCAIWRSLLFQPYPIWRPVKVSHFRQSLCRHPYTSHYTRLERTSLDSSSIDSGLTSTSTDLLESFSKRLSITEGVGKYYDQRSK